jgi:prepilin-type N-terminal cleavage/methylation domain-containing protein
MSKTKGFTLIELMIVVAIIGILSAIAIPKFADLIRKSNEGATKGNLGAIRSAVSIYYGEQEGLFPGATADGTDLTAGSLGNVLTMNNGKYIKSMPNCNIPPFHTANALVTIAVSSSDESTAPGSWGYQESATTATGERPYGDVWVNCTHTDTKTTTWGVY